MSKPKRKSINERVLEKRRFYEQIVDIAKDVSSTNKALIVATVLHLGAFGALSKLQSPWWQWGYVLSSETIITVAVVTERFRGKTKVIRSG